MNDLVVKNVDMFGDNVIAAQDEDGVIWAGVKWFCEGLGLSEGQRQRQTTNIGEDIVLRKGVANLLLPTNGGKQEVLCLKLDFIPLWLAKISITPSMKENKPELVDKLVKYQLKAKDVLAAAFLPQYSSNNEKRIESLSSANETVKILTPFLESAGLDSKIQLLTVKSVYGKAGLELPITIEADQKYYDTVYIARQVGIYVKSSGKPADKAVNEIIRRLNITEGMYIETWESKGKWQGTVRKYSDHVINMIKEWCALNDYPEDIQYVQSDGKKKCYHVIWKNAA